MKKQLLGLAFVFTSVLGVIAQDATAVTEPIAAEVKKPSNWKLKALFGLNGTQSSFVNWNAGGRNNLSLIAFISASADFSKGKWSWKNNLELALGGMKYLDKEGRKQGIQKTDDKIDLATSVGYKFHEKWNATFIGGFRTQFMDGFAYPNDSIRVSTFMAPGYANFALGVEYNPTKHLSLFLSPIATKMTFVLDDSLANAGAFGVKDAMFSSNGDIISKSKGFRGELGAYFRLMYAQEIAKNINVKTKLELFSNYINKPQNIDVNADMLWTFKVNSWLSASLNWTLIYDDDIKIRDGKGGVGPRTQFKSVLGLGLSYTLKNFNDK